MALVYHKKFIVNEIEIPQDVALKFSNFQNAWSNFL